MALPSPCFTQWMVTLLMTLILRSGVGDEAADSGMSQVLRDFIVARHNSYRTTINAKNMLQMRWWDKLEQSATEYVDQCDFEHQTDPEYGENIYRSEIGNSEDAASRGVFSWNVEYSYMMVAEQTGEPCCDADVNTTLCCNYQQMVWSDTRKVGCALKKCGNLTGPDQTYTNAWFFACLYDPPGNVAGVLPYVKGQRGEECTQCPEFFTRCEESLCYPASYCRNPDL